MKVWTRLAAAALMLLLAGAARAERPYRYLRYGPPASQATGTSYTYGGYSGFFRMRTVHRSNYDGYSSYGRYGLPRRSNGQPFYYPRKYYGYGYYGSPAYRLPSRNYSRYYPASPPRVRYRISGRMRIGSYLPG